MNKDTRYPYTYSADYIRSFTGSENKGIKLSRHEASQIRIGIAVAVGISDEELARTLADYHLANEAEITNRIASTWSPRSKS